MTPREIKSLIAAFEASDLAEMEIAREGWTLRLVRAAGGAAGGAAPAAVQLASPGRPAALAVPDAGPAGEIRAPLAGLAYLSPEPDAPAFAAPGARVEAGAVVAVVEAMKVFNEVRTERGGVVEAVLVASGDEVEAGQLLLRIG